MYLSTLFKIKNKEMPASNTFTWGVEVHKHLRQFIFPKVINGGIDTNEFLNASRNVIQLIDKFGKVFAPLKYDMLGNIEKLSQRYVADKFNHATIQSLILLEKETGKNSVAADALLWLTRELRMIQILFDKIIYADKTGDPAEDLTPILNSSYEEVFVAHHGWMAQQLFELVTRMIPTRSQLLLSLANNKPGVEEITINSLDIFTKQLKSNVMALKIFLHDNNLGYIL